MRRWACASKAIGDRRRFTARILRRNRRCVSSLLAYNPDMQKDVMEWHAASIRDTYSRCCRRYTCERRQIICINRTGELVKVQERLTCCTAVPILSIEAHRRSRIPDYNHYTLVANSSSIHNWIRRCRGISLSWRRLQCFRFVLQW